MRILVIGACGKMGRGHVKYLKELGCEVYGLDVNPNINLISKEIGFIPIDGIEEIQALGIDGITVAVPPGEEPDICKRLLEMDMNILCEKPVALSTEAVSSIIDAEKRSKGRVMVGFTMKYDASFIKMREVIKSGKIGKVVGINAKKCWRASTSWRFKKNGGVVFIKDIHYFDLIPWLLGIPIEDVFAIGGNDYYGGESEDNYFLLSKLSGNIPFSLISAWWSYDKGESYFEVLGTKGGLVVDKKAKLYLSGEEVEIFREDPLKVELREFMNMIRGVKKAFPDLTNALNAIRIAECVKNSLETGKVVECR